MMYAFTSVFIGACLHFIANDRSVESLRQAGLAFFLVTLIAGVVCFVLSLRFETLRGWIGRGAWKMCSLPLVVGYFFVVTLLPAAGYFVIYRGAGLELAAVLGISGMLIMGWGEL
jgi:hypothetical protein